MDSLTSNASVVVGLMELLQQCQAVTPGHFVFKGGGHGDVYVNCRRLIDFPEAMSWVADKLAEQCQELKCTAVIGAGTFGQTFARLFAQKLSERCGRLIRFCPAKKKTADPQEREFIFEDGVVPPSLEEPAVIADDILTSGGTVSALFDLAQTVVGVAVICNRSDLKSISGVSQLISLANLPFVQYPASDCPLCRSHIPINLEVGHGKSFVENRQRADLIEAAKRIVLALDTDDINEAASFIKQLQPFSGIAKIHAAADDIGVLTAVRQLQAAGALGGIWIDYKLCDIPATMGRRAAKIAAAGATHLTVMADADVDGMRAAAKGFRGAGGQKIFGVTILTSKNSKRVEVVHAATIEVMVLRYAHLVLEAGLDGLICSPEEAKWLRRDPKFSSLLLVTPGVRPAGVSANDQERFTTPYEAIINGSDLLVIGRPILQAVNPLQAYRDITQEIAGAIAK